MKWSKYEYTATHIIIMGITVQVFWKSDGYRYSYLNVKSKPISDLKDCKSMALRSLHARLTKGLLELGLFMNEKQENI